ncbi:MAG: phosphoenolpyruvate carboxykinase [Butyrivibrio sp.]|nr:phosphoenolpyruvate carboxykinase [Acetatifactor muris]MCM1561456.1 phosphoenolpyruvate carboxykinase [Butyrivibrio sp.]
MGKLWSALTDDLQHCYITGSCNVAIHHVFPGTGRRKLCEKYGFIVPLEPALHNMSGASVHSNPNTGLDLQLKQECQRYFEIHNGSRKEFIEVFGKSYL